MKYYGKPWKVIKCPDCGKYFKSEYSAEYHKNNAETLCPMYDHLQHIEGELEDRAREN